MYKNVASQRVAIFAWDGANGQPKGGYGTGIHGWIAKDNGTFSAMNDTNPTENGTVQSATGIYHFDLLQAETNADLVMIAPTADNTDVVIRPMIIYTRLFDSTKAGYLDLAVSDVAADVWEAYGTRALTDKSNFNLAGNQSAVTFGTVNDATVSDKTGFSLMADQSAVTLGTVNDLVNNSDKVGYSLASDQSTITIGTVNDLRNNSDKTGYGLASNQLAVSLGTVNALGAQAISDINVEVDNALDTAIPGSPTADSINERVKAIDNKLPSGNISDFDESSDKVNLNPDQSTVTIGTSNNIGSTGVTSFLTGSIDQSSVGMHPTTLRDKIQAIFNYVMRKRTVTSTQETTYEKDNSTVMGTWVLSDDGSTASKAP